MTSTSAPPTRSELIERFTAPGQPFEIGEDEVRGLPMRVFTTGPRTLRDIALALAAFGGRPFLVYRDERWTYAEQARIIAGLASCLRDEYGLRKGDRMAGGWFRTGDLGRVDDGWVYVVDRLKDVIIRGGENIYCAEVEAALFEHPAIDDVALVGVPDPKNGEEAVAVVVTAAQAALTADEVRRHVGERLASFKVPAYVVFRSQPLPRTASGKVLKRELRSAVAAEVSTGYAGH